MCRPVAKRPFYFHLSPFAFYPNLAAKVQQFLHICKILSQKIKYACIFLIFVFFLFHLSANLADYCVRIFSVSEFSSSSRLAFGVFLCIRSYMADRKRRFAFLLHPPVLCSQMSLRVSCSLLSCYSTSPWRSVAPTKSFVNCRRIIRQ